MPGVFNIVLYLLLFLTYNCIPINEEESPIRLRVINGNKGIWSKNPSLVPIREGNVIRCGGALISKDLVLTAAHCVIDVTKLSIWAYYADQAPSGITDSTLLNPDFNENKTVGEDNISEGGSSLLGKGPNGAFMIHKIAKAEIHPEYVSASETKDFSKNDVAILKLETPVSDRRFLAIDRGNITKVNDMAIFAGWGRTDSKNPMSMSPILNETEMPIYPFETCNKSYEGLNAAYHLCAGYKDGRTSACEGDSGGPLVIDNTVVGVASFVRSKNCLKASYPTVFTRINTYTSWIDLHFINK